MFKTILVATDGSEHADKAVEIASDLAGKYDAKLIIFHALLSGDRAEQLRHWAEVEHIVPTRWGSIATALGDIPLAKAPHGGDQPPYLTSTAAEAVGDQLLKGAKRVAREKGVKDIESTAAEGDPASEILKAAGQKGADLIVMGSRGLSDLKGLLVGSVSHKVAHLAECTCLTVR
jgi:nucleotide-binding universal stress UspA family protein